MEGFLGCDERVERRGNEDPCVDWVVEGVVARGAEEDKVFERIEIGQLDNTTALEFGELEMKSV